MQRVLALVLSPRLRLASPFMVWGPLRNASHRPCGFDRHWLAACAPTMVFVRLAGKDATADPVLAKQFESEKKDGVLGRAQEDEVVGYHFFGWWIFQAALRLASKTEIGLTQWLVAARPNANICR